MSSYTLETFAEEANLLQEVDVKTHEGEEPHDIQLLSEKQKQEVKSFLSLQTSKRDDDNCLVMSNALISGCFKALRPLLPSEDIDEKVEAQLRKLGYKHEKSRHCKDLSINVEEVQPYAERMRGMREQTNLSLFQKQHAAYFSEILSSDYGVSHRAHVNSIYGHLYHKHLHERAGSRKFNDTSSTNHIMDLEFWIYRPLDYGYPSSKLLIPAEAPLCHVTNMHCNNAELPLPIIQKMTRTKRLDEHDMDKHCVLEELCGCGVGIDPIKIVFLSGIYYTCPFPPSSASYKYIQEAEKAYEAPSDGIPKAPQELRIRSLHTPLYDVPITMHTRGCYIHLAGTCEHTFMIVDVIRQRLNRSRSDGLPAHGTEFFRSKAQPILCAACTQLPAVVAHYFDIRLPHHPTLLCYFCDRAYEAATLSPVDIQGDRLSPSTVLRLPPGEFFEKTVQNFPLGNVKV